MPKHTSVDLEPIMLNEISVQKKRTDIDLYQYENQCYYVLANSTSVATQTEKLSKLPIFSNIRKLKYSTLYPIGDTYQ